MQGLELLRLLLPVKVHHAAIDGGETGRRIAGYEAGIENERCGGSWGIERAGGVAGSANLCTTKRAATRMTTNMGTRGLALCAIALGPGFR